MTGQLRPLRLAGHHLLSDCLASLATDSGVGPGVPAEAPAAGGDEVVFRGCGLVAGSDRDLTCTSGPGGLRVAVAGVGTFLVTTDGRTVRCLEAAPGAAAPTLEEAALGPAAMLALALRGTFSLHASAVAIGDACVAFVGPSGAGKSTLARLLDLLPGLCRRVADDIVPISLAADGPLARLDFPQPKVAPGELARMQQQPALPLAAVCILSPASGHAVEARELSAAAGALAMLHATVAARLFPAELRVRHLEWCASLAERVPVVRLAYPWTGEAESVAATIVDLGTQRVRERRA